MKPAILQRDAPVLREIAEEVPLEEISSTKIQSLIKGMQEALHAEEDGVAIAAPQIGERLRIFVVNGETLAHLEAKKKKVSPESVKPLPDLVFINPVLTKLSKKKRAMEEGCLSVRWLYGQVQRSEKAHITAHDPSGRKIALGASGLLAQIFQHEVDHLNGILFTDTATNLEDLPPEKQAELEAQSHD